MFDFILRPIRRRFGRDKEFYAAIDDMFGFMPHNIELYKLALIHKSASVELEDGSHINNERLEFLGDAVIESITSDYLFIEFPDRDEGFMTQLRSKIVSRQSLNRIASKVGLDKHVISNATGNVTQKHIYGDAFEAMMGAIYLDMGYDFANRLLINDIFVRYLSIYEVMQSETDFKRRLIEWCQKNHYSIEFRTQNDGSSSLARPVFISTVYIDGIAVGHGSGDSKKQAEQRAARSVGESKTPSIDDEDSAKILDRLDKMAN
jgi:ribonuclease-3